MTEQRLSSSLAVDVRETAAALATAARGATLEHFRNRDLEADNKARSGFDPVTAADRAAERAMRDILANRRPDDGIVGEEFGKAAGTSGLTWILDPVDGTRAFLAGAPTWGVLIGVADEDGAVYGIIDQPYIGERFVGGLGEAYCEGPRGRTELTTRGARSLDEAILLSTSPEIGTADEDRAFAAVAERVRLTRYGLDCYAYALLAAGHVDLVIEAGLNTHDVAAPIAIIEAAGGVVTDWQGGDALGGGQVLAAANAAVHAAAREALAGG